MDIVFRYAKSDDDCLYMEIIDKQSDDYQRRIAFYFEKNLAESSWNFVENSKAGGRMQCGILEQEFIDQLREQLKEA